MLIPRKRTPSLTVPTLTGEYFDLSSLNVERGTLVVFYRGLHCPICAKYLTELDKLTPDFEQRGLKVIAISSDGQEGAQQMSDKIKAQHLQFGYDLPLPVAKDWGLYISTSRGKTSLGIEEPALFSEPGLFMVNPDQTLYFASISTMPFVRPNFSELLGALDFIIQKQYPARGEYTGKLS